MSNKKTTITVTPETHYEIRRLGKLWNIPIAQVWEICCHYTARQAGSRGQTAANIAAIRQAEAKIEMLPAR
jgi:hypothetical protein